ncbi:two-component system, chemotaxis family, response regulator CheB [Filomicrobium insigne]|uniref:Protein-glutamate methylesterase/protein-glutamine glutaminase n=1 Tax=Filomicrobium insigne TaxID=418854 RepID=A0A1H0NIJ3_9HYPH|nr:chemotaxis response regulator protein-glutamate methylesterase [Filomicrobium insigne]SDO92514.1 two-component system, chemotaxis family, response regulator CheB [Filomicrobium insigne]
MPGQISVLVVDDSGVMRRALTRRIQTDSRFRVIDTASDGREGVEKTLKLRPDVVTLDVEMPVMNGLEALRVIVSQTRTPVVMVSSVTKAGANITMEALEIGAVDFIAKSNSGDMIHEKLLAAARAKLQRPAPIAPRTRVATPKLAATSRTHSLRTSPPKLCLIGSSTGGPQALQQVFGQLPASLKVPIVVAQHMPAQFTDALAKRLNQICRPNVVEAKDGDFLSPGAIYIAPGGMQTRIVENQIRVSADKGESLYKPSIDVLGDSIFQAYGGRVLGVMLTGMGADGTKAFLKMHNAGAFNIAQSEDTCAVYGMPRALVEANAADEQLDPEQIGARIANLIGK